MKALKLTGYRCSSCFSMYDNGAMAEKCCLCSSCGKPLLGPGFSVCTHCHAEETERAEIETSNVVSYDEYDGDGIYDPSHDEYFHSLCELDDHCRERGRVRPSWVWAAHRKPLSFDAERLIEGEVENGNHASETIDFISSEAIELLQKLMDGWVDEYAQVFTWGCDRDLRVMLPPPEPDDEFEDCEDTEAPPSVVPDCDTLFAKTKVEHRVDEASSIEMSSDVRSMTIRKNVFRGL